MTIEKQERLYEVLIRFDHETGAVKGAHQRMMQTVVEDGIDIVPPRELMPTALDPAALADVLEPTLAATLNRITDCEKAVVLLDQENKVLARNVADRDAVIARLTATNEQLRQAVEALRGGTGAS